MLVTLSNSSMSSHKNVSKIKQWREWSFKFYYNTSFTIFVFFHSNENLRIFLYKWLQLLLLLKWTFYSKIARANIWWLSVKWTRNYIPCKFPIIGHPFGPGGKLYFFVVSIFHIVSNDRVTATNPTQIPLSVVSGPIFWANWFSSIVQGEIKLLELQRSFSFELFMLRKCPLLPLNILTALRSHPYFELSWHKSAVINFLNATLSCLAIISSTQYKHYCVTHPFNVLESGSVYSCLKKTCSALLVELNSERQG